MHGVIFPIGVSKVVHVATCMHMYMWSTCVLRAHNMGGFMRVCVWDIMPEVKLSVF